MIPYFVKPLWKTMWLHIPGHQHYIKPFFNVRFVFSKSANLVQIENLRSQIMWWHESTQYTRWVVESNQCVHGSPLW